MTKLQELREAIIRVVPEIVELKFGCEVVLKDGFRGVFLGRNYAGTSMYWNAPSQQSWAKKAEIVGVIGRPIQLADVLLTLERTQQNYKIGVYGHKLIINHYTVDGYESHEYWNLAKPLEDQEPAVINFLHGIICQK